MEQQREYVFDLSGGSLPLDFLNTVGGFRGVRTSEHLHDYRDLVAFGRQTGAISIDQSRRLEAEARRRPDEAAAVLERAKELREALYRIFLAIVEHRAPSADDRALMNAALGDALAHREVVESGEKLALGWNRTDALDSVLWPIVDAAAGLLVSGDLARVRVCGMYEDEECSWLFLDRTKARTRRWCSMKDCGNRAKARRFQARKKEHPKPAG